MKATSLSLLFVASLCFALLCGIIEAVDVTSICIASKTALINSLSVPPMDDKSLMHVNSLELFIAALTDVDVRSKRVSVQILFTLTWYPTTFWEYKDCPMKSMSLLGEQIFTPRIQVSNQIGKADLSTDTYGYVINVTTLPTEKKSVLIMQSYQTVDFYCEMGVNNYPFDSHTCNIDVSLLPMISPSNTSGKYQQGIAGKNQWQIRKFYAATDGVLNHFTLDFYRSASYAITTQVIPLFFLTMMPLITFILPPNSGEKMAVSLSIVLTNFLLGVTFFDEIPGSGNLPLLAYTFIYMVSITMISAVITAIILRVSDTNIKLAEKANNIMLVLSIIFMYILPTCLLLVVVTQ